MATAETAARARSVGGRAVELAASVGRAVRQATRFDTQPSGSAAGRVLDASASSGSTVVAGHRRPLA